MHIYIITFRSVAKHPNWYRTERTPWLDFCRKPLSAGLNFGFSTNLKWIQTPHAFKFECKFKPLQGYLAWGSAPAQLGLVRLASTNSGCFLVGCCRCGQLQAGLRKKCYHSGNTDLVWGSNASMVFNNGPWQVTDNIFFVIFLSHENLMDFATCKNLLQTKAVPIAWASLNLAIIHCLWKNILHQTKSACPELSPVQSSRSKSMPSAQILIINWAAQQIQMASHKSLEKNLCYNSESIATNFAAKKVANEKQCLKASFRFQ